jgi:ribonuclease T2
VNPPRLNKATVALAIAVIGALITWFSQRDAGNSRRQAPATSQNRPKPATNAQGASKSTFDFYLLALSLHPAFCADGHADKSECRAGARHALSLHGLWPEKLEPGAYPHDCPAPALNLDAGLAMQLEDFMPGMASDLHEHEWRKHGGCSGLPADEYFGDALELTRVVDSALSAKLTTLAGREATAEELRETADSYHPGLGQTLTFQCRTIRDASQSSHGRPFLIEVRQCVDNDGANGAPATLLDCASVNRRDQGCGGSFYIARARNR